MMGNQTSKWQKSIASAIKETEINCAIVCGGGKEARDAANKARNKYNTEFDADLAGIKITHKNANSLRTALGKLAGKTIFFDFEKARKATKKQKYVLMGGTIPGITTDADAALLAEAIKATHIVNVSKTAIYDCDPRKNKNAKKFKKLNFNQLKSLALKSDKRKAGTHFIFDLLACSLIARSNIKTHFVDGRNLQDLKNAILDKKHRGTTVNKK